jgi:selenocysteine-specific elongation factor
MIVATAGHVDHGKTELIRALTGIDTDRLPEEKARGLSIDLGFAYQPMADDKVIGFVDVPGHEKFIRNMLAGVGGIDLGLLVVAADDGVMPQTREHTAILDLLGIESCLVAITKVDMVSEARVLEVHEEVEELISGTQFAGADMFELCAPQGLGVAALRDAIGSFLSNFVARSSAGNFRLAIDRSFTLKGIGLVVTGTVVSGEVRAQDQLVISPRGIAVRVRGVRAHDKLAEVACAGDRCALNIAGRGVSESNVARGDWVLHESLHEPTDRIDINLSVLPQEQKSLKHWTPVHIHHGAGHLTGRVAVLEGGAIEPGERGRVQLVLEKDTAAVWGDRLVIRDQSARRTLGGGVVVDPYSPKRGRARPDRIAWLRGMEQTAHGVALEAMAGATPAGVPLTRFQRARNLTSTELEGELSGRSLVGSGRPPDDRVIAGDTWLLLRHSVMEFMRDYHETHADQLGPDPREIRFGIEYRIGDDIVEHLLSVLLEEKAIGRRGQIVHLHNHTVRLSAKDHELWGKVGPKLTTADGSPPSLQQAAELLGLEKGVLEGLLKRAVRAGWVVQIAKNRFITLETFDELTNVLKEVARDHPEGFTAAVP